MRVNPNSGDKSSEGGFGDIFNEVHTRIDKTVKDIGNLKRGLKSPTIPLYDSTNFPDNPNRGQTVRDVNDPSVMWIYGEDDQWHKIGGGGTMDWIIVKGIGHYTTGFNDFAHFELPAADWHGVNQGSLANWNITVDLSNGEGYLIRPTTPGLYLAGFTTHWDNLGAPYEKSCTLYMIPASFGPSWGTFSGQAYTVRADGTQDDLSATVLCPFLGPGSGSPYWLGYIGVGLDSTPTNRYSVTYMWAAQIARF